MPKAFCNGCGQEIVIPDGIKGGEIFDCPT